jgi:hypothetical protein
VGRHERDRRFKIHTHVSILPAGFVQSGPQ